MAAPGSVIASTLHSAAALGFVPVAIHFDLFPLINRIGPIATALELKKASDAERTEDEKRASPLSDAFADRGKGVELAADTMYAMAGLGLVDLIDDDTYGVNELTKYTVKVPSCLDGMLHFTTEPLWAAAFLMRQLRDTNFKYPFSALETPTQYGYKLIQETQYADKDFYTILHMQGRMSSLNRFMEGKFGKFGTMPERVKCFGYDLDKVMKSKESNVAIVDVGGGRGEMLLEVLQAYPHLGKQNLILQDFKPEEVNAGRLTIMHWDFKEDSPQPIRGALVYSLTHVYHNMGDLDALTLMKNISDAMAPYSRMLIHEFPKNATYGKMNSTMIVQFGGKERNSREWKQMAALAGLKVMFEAYPVTGEGLVEMVKL